MNETTSRILFFSSVYMTTNVVVENRHQKLPRVDRYGTERCRAKKEKKKKILMLSGSLLLVWDFLV